MTVQLQSPAQELRFTRAGQAPTFWLLAAVAMAAAITILVTAYHRPENPELPHPAWAAIPCSLAIASARLAWHLTRHAYLILTPIGLEIFPFFRPASGMRLITWNEVAAAEINHATRRLTIHYNREKTAGLHLALDPIQPSQRHLLATALTRQLHRCRPQAEN